MIERILMSLGEYIVLIDNKMNTCVINDKICELRSDDVSNIIRIIREWDYVYRNNKVISENKYNITVVSDVGEYNYIFDGKFPVNFLDLVSYVGEMNDR